MNPRYLKPLHLSSYLLDTTLAIYGENDVVAQSVLREVLANAANVDARDANGKTAENWATDYKREHLAEQLRLLRESRSKEH